MAQGSSEESYSSSSSSSVGSADPSSNGTEPKKLPKGVVLGKDGKPCRTCTSFASWAALTKSQTGNPPSPPESSSTSEQPPPAPNPDCPPDVEALGRSTWTLLHSMTANYPPAAPATLQSKTRQFLSLFSELYPCWVCAEDFQDWISRPGNEPRVAGREEFGLWMCRAHNEVNRKLGKAEFDCRVWKERWRDGWRGGRCD